MKAPLLAGIKKYFQICDEEKELQAAAADQTRLLGRGRDPGRLLREEKMRKRVQKEKPRVRLLTISHTYSCLIMTIYLARTRPPRLYSSMGTRGLQAVPYTRRKHSTAPPRDRSRSSRTRKQTQDDTVEYTCYHPDRAVRRVRAGWQQHQRRWWFRHSSCSPRVLHGIIRP